MNDFFKNTLQLILTFDVDAVILHVFIFRFVNKSNWKGHLSGTLQLLNADVAIAGHEVFRLHMLISAINMLQNAELFWQQISIFFNQLFFQSSPAKLFFSTGPKEPYFIIF